MPKRPREHRLDEDSVAAFTAALAERFLFREDPTVGFLGLAIFVGGRALPRWGQAAHALDELPECLRYRLSQ